MNLLVKKFGPLAAVLLSAFIAISCEDPGRIGLILSGDNGVISTHYEDIILPTTMVQFNIRKTVNSTIIQAGEYLNADFGRTTTKTYSWLSFGAIPTPDATATFKSFELSIAFSNYIGESFNPNEIQKIGIYQLAEEIDTTREYTRLDQLALNPTPLGIWSFAPLIDDTVRTDSTYLITLDETVGRDLFDKFKAGDPIFDNSVALNEYFKGVAFVPEGPIYDIFQLSRDIIKFTINYEEENSDGTPIARELSMRVGSTHDFYYLDSDKSGTPIAGITPNNANFEPASGYRYLQYGTMMAIRADLTPFYDLTKDLKNVIINKAELYVGQIKDYNEGMTPPPFLYMYFTDETNKWPVVDDIGRIDSTKVGVNFITLQDEGSLTPPGIYSLPAVTSYNADERNYKFAMSWFFQNVYAGNFHSEEEPFLEEKGQIYLFGESNVILPQRTNSHALTYLMAVHQDSIRLRIYYTVPNQENP